KLRELAGKFQSRDTDGHLKLDDLLAAEFAGQSEAIRVHINTGLKAQVDPIRISAKSDDERCVRKRKPIVVSRRPYGCRAGSLRASTARNACRPSTRVSTRKGFVVHGS